MKNKTVKKGELKAAASVIMRIIKDTRDIMPQLILAAVVSLASIVLSLIAPELIGELTDSIYAYLNEGVYTE